MDVAFLAIAVLFVSMLFSAMFSLLGVMARGTSRRH